MGTQPIPNTQYPIPNKVALLTGAARPPGPTLAITLAAQGWRVALNDLNPRALDEIVNQITETGGSARAHIADISSKVALQTILNDIEDEWGHIDTLINNTRVIPTKSILDMDEWDWRRTLDVNLTSAFLLTQVVGRMMRARGGGVIVHLIQPDEGVGHAAYAATRAGVEALVRVAERELGGFGIRVVSMDMGTETENLNVISEVMDICIGTIHR